MSYTDILARELSTAREAMNTGNHGKARTCARRAVGVAATELQRLDPELRLGADFMTQVRSISQDDSFSEQVRRAAERLQSKISQDFTSASTDPIGDAELVLVDLVSRITEIQARSSDK